VSTDQEYDTQQTRSMLDEPDVEDLGATRSPVLHGTYPPQFDHVQGQQPRDFYTQSRGSIPSAQSRQTPPQTQFEQPQMIPPTSHPAAAEDNYDVDPNDPMLDADPFNLGANMQVLLMPYLAKSSELTTITRHYPNAYAYDQHPQR
jgi:hypothetical protein